MIERNNNLSGQCQCENIRYRVRGEPLTFYACHCLDCQKQSASAFGLSMWVLSDDFELTEGRLNFWTTIADDGSKKECAFCPQCGTRIYHMIDDGSSSISLKAGTLDDATLYKPVAHIWTKRAHQWLELEGPEILNYPDQPDSFSDILEAWAARDSG